MKIKSLFTDFIQLIYPNTCLLCNETLTQQESHLCLMCLHKLPKTNYHLQTENPVEKRFWGKVHVERATSFLYFQKGESVQKLLHRLKYKGEKEIGELLGKQFAHDLKDSTFAEIDLIVPVPLHKKRYNKRGYNQSAQIAKGLSETLNKPVDTQTVVRNTENETQTQKSVYERFENTANIFSLTDNTAFENKHILLVDDVLTTGSTLEACAQAILHTKNAKVSIVTLALA